LSGNIAAIKTEYQGVVFDSKSEAVFARTMDMCGHQWFYHPTELGDHEWDFLVFRKPQRIKNKASVNYWSQISGGKMVRDFVSHVDHFYNWPPILVEYKPTAPTDTYIENLTESMRRGVPFESVIVWGSPWNGPVTGERCSYVSYPVFCSFDSKYGWGDFNREADTGGALPTSSRHPFGHMFNCSESIIQMAKSFRFDLR
jgi:hypothetical protein